MEENKRSIDRPNERDLQSDERFLSSRLVAQMKISFVVFLCELKRSGTLVKIKERSMLVSESKLTIRNDVNRQNEHTDKHHRNVSEHERRREEEIF